MRGRALGFWALGLQGLGSRRAGGLRSSSLGCVLGSWDGTKGAPNTCILSSQGEGNQAFTQEMP